MVLHFHRIVDVLNSEQQLVEDLFIRIHQVQHLHRLDLMLGGHADGCHRAGTAVKTHIRFSDRNGDPLDSGARRLLSISAGLVRVDGAVIAVRLYIRGGIDRRQKILGDKLVYG